MLVGHYAASLVLKKFEQRVSLGVLFLAVQFVDILFAVFDLLGIERMNIVENFTQSTHFELEYIPYTHSLLASVLWAAAAYVLFRWVIVKKNSVAIIVALAVFSHWLFDLIVHTPDMPLWTDDSYKFGFGLWDSAIMTYALEAIILLAALWVYLRSTSASTAVGKYGMAVFVILLLLANIGIIFGPMLSDSKVALATTSLAFYFLLAAVAFWLDRKRSEQQ